MPRITLEGPDGQRHTLEGPEGATPADAYKVLQQRMGPQTTPDTPGILKSAASGLIQGAGAPGDVSKSVLGNAPPQQPIDKDTYYGKLVEALNHARNALELPTTPQVGNAVGMQPSQPVTLPEKAVQMGARALPGIAMGGNLAGRAAMGAAPAANAVRGMAMSPQGPASSIGGAGDALQNQLLKAGLQHGAGAVGHAVGGPIGGAIGNAIGRYGPKMLGM